MIWLSVLTITTLLIARCPTSAGSRAQGVGVPSGLVEGAGGRSASQSAHVVDAKPDMDEDFAGMGLAHDGADYSADWFTAMGSRPPRGVASPSPVGSSTTAPSES